MYEVLPSTPPLPWVFAFPKRCFASKERMAQHSKASSISTWLHLLWRNENPPYVPGKERCGMVR